MSLACVGARWLALGAVLGWGSDALLDRLDVAGWLGPVVASVNWVGGTPLTRVIAAIALLILLTGVAVAEVRVRGPAAGRWHGSAAASVESVDVQEHPVDAALTQFVVAPTV